MYNFLYNNNHIDKNTLLSFEDEILETDIQIINDDNEDDQF